MSTKSHFQAGEVAPDVFTHRAYHVDSNGRRLPTYDVYYDAMPKVNNKRVLLKRLPTVEEAIVEVQRYKRTAQSSVTGRSLNLAVVPTPAIKKEWQATFYRDLPDVAAAYGKIKNVNNPELAKVYAEVLDEESLNEAALWAAKTPIIIARDIHLIIGTTTPFTQWQRQRSLGDEICAADAAFELARHRLGHVFDPKHPRKNPHYAQLKHCLEALLPGWNFVSTELAGPPDRNPRTVLQYDQRKAHYLEAVAAAEAKKEAHSKAVAAALAQGRQPPPAPPAPELPPKPQLWWRVNVTCKHCGAEGVLFTLRNKTCEACHKREPKTTAAFTGLDSNTALWITPRGYIVSSERPVDATHVGLPKLLNKEYAWKQLPPLHTRPDADFIPYDFSDATIPLDDESQVEAPEIAEDEAEETGAAYEGLRKANDRLADDMPL